MEISEATKQRYFQNLLSQLQLMRTAMERSDNKALQEACHRVRGSAALFGLRDLGEACGLLESACLEGHSDVIVAGFQVLEIIARRHLSASGLGASL